MAHALESVAECGILQSHPALSFRDRQFVYRIVRDSSQSIYSVSDGRETLTVPLQWAFGLGSAGQTYSYEKDGRMYQTRVSYYSAINGLDFTLGAQNAKAGTLAEAAGQLMDADEQKSCFGCHATGAVTARKLTLDTLQPGVQCERCHGASAAHLAAVRSGNAGAARMDRLGAMSTEQTSNFCGGCHRTWDQIASSDIHGVINVRFQPYRLTNSKCYDTDDRRIRCTACHDPHGEIDRVAAYYDSKCQACHGGGKKTALRCKVARADCVSCHMPKIEIPGSHHQFTDHNIRIARANAPYPD